MAWKTYINPKSLIANLKYYYVFLALCSKENMVSFQTLLLVLKGRQLRLWSWFRLYSARKDDYQKLYMCVYFED